MGAVVATLWRDLFSWKAALLLGALFFVLPSARGRSVAARLDGDSRATPTHELVRDSRRGLVPFYYLLYALEHAPREVATPLIPLVIAAIVASVVLHGVTATPLMNRYRQIKGRH